METDSVQTISQINRDLEIDNAQSEVCCGGIQRKLRSLLPVNYKDELLLVLKLAGPVAVTGGIVRGAGKQVIGDIVGYYFVGFPIGVSPMFAVNMGIMDLWVGFFCLCLQTLSFVILIWKLDWKKATEEALVRAGIQEPDGTVESNAIENTGYQEISQVAKHIEENQTDANTNLEALRKAEGGIAVALVPVREVLTSRQLVVRRGFAVFFMLLILAAGIVLNELLTDFFR